MTYDGGRVLALKASGDDVASLAVATWNSLCLTGIGRKPLLLEEGIKWTFLKSL